MTWYKSHRHNDFRYIFRQWLITTLLVFIPIFIDIIFPQVNFINRSNWYVIISVLSITTLIRLCQEDRVNEIIVDPEFREITFKYYDINEGQVWKSYPFEQIRLQISKNKMPWVFEPVNICFFIGRSEIMSVSKSKDGFSVQVLESLSRTLEDLTSVIKK